MQSEDDDNNGAVEVAGINIETGINFLQKQEKQVAQGQYVVSDTRCPALHDCDME